MAQINELEKIKERCRHIHKSIYAIDNQIIKDRARLVKAVEYLLNEIGPATGHLYSQEAQEQAVNSILKGE